MCFRAVFHNQTAVYISKTNVVAVGIVYSFIECCDCLAVHSHTCVNDGNDQMIFFVLQYEA